MSRYLSSKRQLFIHSLLNSQLVRYITYHNSQSDWSYVLWKKKNGEKGYEFAFLLAHCSIFRCKYYYYYRTSWEKCMYHIIPQSKKIKQNFLLYLLIGEPMDLIVACYQVAASSQQSSATYWANILATSCEVPIWWTGLSINFFI